MAAADLDGPRRGPVRRGQNRSVQPIEAQAPVRVDRWLWAIRLFKTRAAATDACRAGHVRVNGAAAKAATQVRPGDRVDARAHGRTRTFVVIRAVDKRLPPADVAASAIDESPPAPAREPEAFARARGAGRPTKRDRRLLDQLRG